MGLQNVGVYEALRTPRTRAHKGALSNTDPLNLVKPLLDEMEFRFAGAKELCTDLILGCVTQRASQGGNIARLAAQHAGWQALSGMTINRYCCSGLDAVALAASRLESGLDRFLLAGGVESMSMVPIFSDEQKAFSDVETMTSLDNLPIGLAADTLASLHKITREESDHWAMRSHTRANTAIETGVFKRSIVPLEVDGFKIENDQTPNIDLSEESIKTREPSFQELSIERGFEDKILSRLDSLQSLDYVHHKDSSPIKADGGSLLLLGHTDFSRLIGQEPRALIRDVTTTVGDTFLGLSGGIEAVEKLLKNNNLEGHHLDLVEFNEPFAAPTLIAKKRLRLTEDQINVNGSAIGLGHPLGATGGIILGMLLDELERQDMRLGVAAISGAMGTGTAILLERI